MNRWSILCGTLLWLLLGAPGHAQAAKGYPAPIQALIDKGMVITGPLEAPAGFKGYVAEHDGRKMPVYLLPDGRHMMVGSLLDAQANDLTQSAMVAATSMPLDAAAWAALEKSSWIAEGATKPRHVVYVLTDTECPYCHRLWEATQPLLAKGDVQVRHVMVAVIARESLGRAAAILDASDPSAALRKHERAFGHSPIAPEASVPPATVARIRANNALMQRLGATGTPATFYKDASGALQRFSGMMDQARLKAVFDR